MYNSYAERDGKLELYIEDEPGYREVGYELKNYLVGAFKVEVSFASFSATVGGSELAGFKMEYKIDDDNYVIVCRYKSGSGGNGYSSSICIDGTLSYAATGTISDTSGKLKIERTGMIVRTYYWDGASYTTIDSNTEFDTGVGKLKIMAYSDATGTVAVNADNFILYRSPNSIYDSQFVLQQKGSDKISVARRGHRDYKNKITVQYTRRKYSYGVGTIDCPDLVDIDANGVMDVSMRLEALTTLSRAEMMGRLFLKRNINQCEVYAGILGPQHFGTSPGDIVYLSSKKLDMSNVPTRVLAVKEGVGYQIETEFSEEKDIYELDSYASDNTSPSPYIQFYISTDDPLGVTDSRSISAVKNIPQAVQSVSFQESAEWYLYDPNLMYISGATDRLTLSDYLETNFSEKYIDIYDKVAVSEYAKYQVEGMDKLVEVQDHFKVSESRSNLLEYLINRTQQLTLPAPFENTYGPSASWNAGNGTWTTTTGRYIIPESMISKNGTQIKVKLGYYDQSYSIAKMYIGHAASSGDNYDFDGNQVQILFGGNANVTVTSGGATSDSVSFNLNASKNIIISFYCTSAATIPENTTITGYNLYYKAGDDAATTNASGYSGSSQNGKRHLIESIFVNTESTLMMEMKISGANENVYISELGERSSW